MDFRCLFSIIVVQLSVLSTDVEAYKKRCIPYCGNSTGIPCPSGYSCTDWDGCGESCLRTGKYQADDCPMKKCMATDCPLGFERDEKGCEGCLCARQDAIKAIDNQDYPGSAPQLAIHIPLCLSLIYTFIRYF